MQSVVHPRQAAEVARSANDYAGSFFRRYPGRFSAFAAVALQDPKNAAQELERAVTELLLGSAWAFAYETASHAIRLMLSGLFDTYPNLQVILGHLGEGLPYLPPRMQHGLDEQRDGEKGSKAKRRASYYFGSNFWLTTSGHFHTKPFLEAIEQLGEERILFSVDYPYDQMDTVGRWFDDLRIPNELKLKVGRGNANKLLGRGLGSLSSTAASGFGS